MIREYWYTDEKGHDISLGICASQAEIDAGVAEIQSAGDSDLDWSSWSAEVFEAK